MSYSQEIPPVSEQQLENQTDAEQGETEDDAFLQELDQFRKDPINLNEAGADELIQLRMLTGLQISNLVAYRNVLGRLISIYELQAVPGWDIPTIKKLIPFITIETPVSPVKETRRRFRDGEHSLLLRVTQVLEKSDGFNPSTPGAKYLGSPQKVFFRYRYSFKNLLQFGLLGEKDAGEQFGKGLQKSGFDFYSIHFFTRNIGMIQTLALGDFTVNLGQGLIQWQGLAFKKSADVLGVKRQSAVLRPYNSAGEFYFHRGAGFTVRKRKFEATAFASFRKLGANFVADTVNREDYVSSFLSSGYHRTTGENDDRNNLAQAAFGGNITYRNKPSGSGVGNWEIGLNGMYYQFSLPVKKRDEPYNLYAAWGRKWYNLSVDYSYTLNNLHVFGEAAADRNRSMAFINGLLISVDPRVDISVVCRAISASYQAINGNAFTENTNPSNETGFYAAITIRPVAGWRIDAYGDIFRFSWLKYLADAPGFGKDFLAQLTYIPNKQVEIYSRFRTETKQSNLPDNNTVTNFLVSVPKQDWRTQVNYKLSSALTFRTRAELLWYDHQNDKNGEKGFLVYYDVLYKPMLSPINVMGRLQYFETDGYDSRLYAFENDVRYSYSIPTFYDKGFRYYLIFNYDISRRISCWLRWAQTIYRVKTTIGSGADKINGNKKTEIRLQIRWNFPALGGRKE